jgi:Tfp pilus assembly protein FimT
VTRPTSPARRSGAFTLLEVTVVVAVVALVVGVVAPRLAAVEGVVVTGAARRLADAIGFGRERAILGGGPMRLVLDLDASRWVLGHPGPDPATVAADEVAVPPLGPPTDLPTGVRVWAVKVGGGAAILAGVVALDFQPDGDALTARIELTDARGHAATIVVPPASARPVVMAGGAS